MEVLAETKRPWTIKWAVGILICLVLIGTVFEISNNGWKLSSIFGNVLTFLLLFAIWQGRRWARNIFFFLVLFILPLLVAGSGILVTNTKYYDSLDKFWFVYGFFGTIMLLIAVFMTFMKPSNEWFSAIRGEVFQEQVQPSWNFQLTLIGISMGLGFLVIAVNATVSFIPFGKEIMMNFSTYYSRFAVLFTFENLGFLIGVIAVIFPFSLIIGYWKKENIFFISRLITIGVILPILAFPVGKTFFLFSMFFFSKVLIVGVIAYMGLRFGVGTARYIDTLRVPIEIKK